MAHVAAMKQPILNVTPLSREDLQDIKNDFRPPVTSFSGFRSRFSRSQSPAHPNKKGGSDERPKTSSGPASRRIDDFRGRDTKAKDDLTITARSSAGTRRTVTDQTTTTFNFPVSALQTSSKAREITITSRQSRTNSESPSPAPSVYRSRDTTPLGFKEHRAKVVDSRESSRSGLRQRQDSAGSIGYDSRLPLRELGRNTQSGGGTHMASTTSSSLQVEQLPIGMALGSPSQAPPLFQNMMPPARSETMPAPSRRNTPPTQPPLPQIPPHNPNPTTSTVSADKPVKVSKWKLFFGKKSAQDVPKDIDRVAKAATEETEPIKLEVTKGKVGRSRTITEKKSARNLKKERPGLSRVTTAPSSSDEHGTYNKDFRATPFADVRVLDNSVGSGIANAQLNSNNGRRPSTANNGLLGVDIPSVEMERYSVMFSQLLESTKDSPKKISTSNLLARRQATLDRLKTVNESIAELELEEQRLGCNLQKPRRMTSPMASPSLSLYPGGPSHRTPSASAAANKTAPRLHRSHTSPAMLSPNTMTFPTPSRPGPVHSHSYNAKDLVASPTSTVSDDAGPPTPDKHGQLVSVGGKAPELKEPEWEMIDGATSTIKMRQRPNTSNQTSRPATQRVRASTTTHQQPPLAGPRSSNESEISNSNSTQSAASPASSQTTVSSVGNQQMRAIPKIKIRHQQVMEPYPSGIVPGVLGGSMAHLQSLSAGDSHAHLSDISSGTSTPREGAHPERGSSRQQPVPVSHLQGQQDENLSVGMRIPVSRFSTAPARRLPPPTAEDEKPEMEGDEELQIRTAADVSIARQISISRQQSMMLKQRLARGERRRREGERERERRVVASGVGRGEREIRQAIEERDGMLQSRQRGLVPMMVSVEERKSSYGVLEGE